MTEAIIAADSTRADQARAAGVSLPTFDATRGRLMRGDQVRPAAPATTPKQPAVAPPAGRIRIGPGDI